MHVATSPSDVRLQDLINLMDGHAAALDCQVATCDSSSFIPEIEAMLMEAKNVSKELTALTKSSDFLDSRSTTDTELFGYAVRSQSALLRAMSRAIVKCRHVRKNDEA